jgi:hypothetical protein
VASQLFSEDQQRPAGAHSAHHTIHLPVTKAAALLDLLGLLCQFRRLLSRSASSASTAMSLSLRPVTSMLWRGSPWTRRTPWPSPPGKPVRVWRALVPGVHIVACAAQAPGKLCLCPPSSGLPQRLYSFSDHPHRLLSVLIILTIIMIGSGA